MKFVHPALKRIVNLATFVFFAVAAASPAHADDAPLSTIYKGVIHSYYSVNGFYNFSANQADKQQNTLINESIDEIDGVMSELAESELSGTEAYTAAEVAWDVYRKVLKQNVQEVVDTGYPDLRLAGDMASTNIAFNEALLTLYKEASAASQPNEQTQTSRDAAMTIALMMTKYSARSTSTVSQVYSGGDSAEITIDALAEQFDAKVNKLTALTKGSEGAKALDSAVTKWDFIKSSYINYNENRVNFIVNLYSKKIISDIEESLSI